MSAMPTEFTPTVVEPRRASSALEPVTVRPRQSGLLALTIAGEQARPATTRRAPARRRRAAARAHPVGVRACSGVLHAAPPATTPLAFVHAPSRPSGTAPVRDTPAGAAPRAGSPRANAPIAGVSRPAVGAPGLRLTRRGRVVIALCAVAAAVLFGFAVASAAQAADHGAPTPRTRHSMSQIVVQPGQTLWSIAVQADPQADPRLVVQQIMAANSLHSTSVGAGQHLLVPRS